MFVEGGQSGLRRKIAAISRSKIFLISAMASH